MNAVMNFIDKNIVKLYKSGTINFDKKNEYNKIYKVSYMNSTREYCADGRTHEIVKNFICKVNKFVRCENLSKEDNYTNHILLFCYEKAICNYIGNKAHIILFDLLQKLKKWSLKTYEGKKMSFGFIINFSKISDDDKKYHDFLDSNFSAVLSDGQISVIELDYLGHFIKYHSFDEENTPIDRKVICPYKYSKVTSKCCGENIGIVLDDLGNIAIIKQQQIKYAFMNGEWIYYDINDFVQPIYSVLYNQSEDGNKNVELLKSIYNSTLDMIFKGEGCCIAIIEDDYLADFQNIIYKNIDYDDNSNQSIIMKKHFIKKIIAKSYNYDKVKNAENTESKYKTFGCVQRKLREELLSFDGAVIMKKNGEIEAIGEIVSVDGETSPGGGRTKAAIALAKGGLALKISNDGYIECYAKDNATYKVLFKIGNN